jgi:hypothetical protein
MLKYAACVARRLRLYAMSVRCHAVLVYIYIVSPVIRPP